jgi:hypothetical protein
MLPKMTLKRRVGYENVKEARARMEDSPEGQ